MVSFPGCDSICLVDSNRVFRLLLNKKDLGYGQKSRLATSWTLFGRSRKKKFESCVRSTLNPGDKAGSRQRSGRHSSAVHGYVSCRGSLQETSIAI